MNEADPHYAPLRKRYAASLAAKRDDLVRAWRSFADNPGDAAGRRDLHALIHRLSGSAASYGYAHLGAIASAADELMSQTAAHESGSNAGVARLAPSIDALLQALAEADVLGMKEPPAIP